MVDNNQSINEFIKKLKTIDIGELLEKAQTIKIEDLRAVKWKDVYNSKLFFPILGTLISVSDIYNFVGIGLLLSMLYFFIASFACLEVMSCSFAKILKP